MTCGESLRRAKEARSALGANLEQDLAQLGHADRAQMPQVVARALQHQLEVLLVGGHAAEHHSDEIEAQPRIGELEGRRGE